MIDRFYKIYIAIMLPALTVGVFYIGATLDYIAGQNDRRLDYSVYFNDYIPSCLGVGKCDLVIMDTYAYLDMVDGTIIPLENDMLKEGVIRDVR